jgi:hypothetical protein
MEGNQEDITNHTFLTEKGLYKALFKSNHHIAEQFQNWVCDMVHEIRVADIVKPKTELKKDNQIALDYVKYRYENYRNKFDYRNCESDIYEHLPTLYKYAKECNSILECGVRSCVSSWAFAYGLLTSEQCACPTIVLNDIEDCSNDSKDFTDSMKYLDINIITLWKNNLHIDFENDIGQNEVDMTFIDTWHVYGQLRRELEKFAPHTRKYIIMHDTFVDGIYGETIRCRLNAQQQSIDSGFPIEEINIGLIPAIHDFLHNHPEWVIYERYDNCNGLTILARNH